MMKFKRKSREPDIEIQCRNANCSNYHCLTDIQACIKKDPKLKANMLRIVIIFSPGTPRRLES